MGEEKAEGELPFHARSSVIGSRRGDSVVFLTEHPMGLASIYGFV